MTQTTTSPMPNDYKAITEEGSFSGVIKEAKIIEHRFKIGSGYEVKIEAVTSDMQTASMYFDMRDEYVSAGKRKGERQIDVSMDTLEKLGLENKDLSKVKELRGKPISFYSKRNDKNYLNFYISSHEETEVDPAKAAKELAALLGGGSFAPASGGKSESNPFLQS
jgi:hypothetical protein